VTRSSSWRDYLQSSDREGAERFFRDTPPDQIAEDDLGEVLSDAVAEAADQHDSGLGLPVRLDVRVFGQSVGASGRLDLRVTHDLLGSIQGEVISSLPQNVSEESGRLDLVGIGSGSAILRFEPAVKALEKEKCDGRLFLPLDSALRGILDLHDEVESQSPVGEKSITNELIESFHKLISVLDKYDLGLDMVWRVSGMKRRRSRLSVTGRKNANLLLKPTSTRQRETVSGYVHGQNLNGQLILKANPTVKNSTTHVVHITPSELGNLQLRMSDYIVVQVMTEYRRDGFNRDLGKTLEFERIIPHQEGI
jgi:hypothetical protein